MTSRSLLDRARQQRQRQSQASPTPDNESPSSPFSPSTPLPSASNDIDSPNPLMPAQALILRNQSMPVAQLKTVGERHLKRIKLEDETPNKDECNAIVFLHMLHVKDLYRQALDQHVQIKKFVRTLLLLPNLRFYSGMVESAVMIALRRCAVKDLPTSDDFDDDVLKAAVARQFSTDKSEIKKMLKDSTEVSDVASRNIAEVMGQILAKYCPEIQLTLIVTENVLYIQRTRASKPHSNSKFWPDLDQELEGLHEEGPEVFVSAMQINYEDDVAKYGDPANTKHKVAKDTVPSGSKKFLIILHELAPKVQRVNSNGKHTVADDNEPEDEPEENLGGSGEDCGGQLSSRTSSPTPDDSLESSE
ncbi:hypothetical protein B0H13DRAFT_2336586 [Mycena leptocephala]|nr:hypothetical protein B0H13DRAFT_2336586 [Mycena leptocephala]